MQVALQSEQGPPDDESLMQIDGFRVCSLTAVVQDYLFIEEMIKDENLKNYFEPNQTKHGARMVMLDNSVFVNHSGRNMTHFIWWRDYECVELYLRCPIRLQD
jgi:hypothetical protein